MTLSLSTEISPAAATPEQEVVYAVEGMSCASCVGRVEQALKAVPGVAGASVNLATARAYVRQTADEGLKRRIESTLAALGYPAHVVAGAAEEEQRGAETRQAEATGLRVALGMAAAATLPLFIIEMGSHLIPALHHALMEWPGMRAVGILSFLLASLVQFGPGWRFYRLGLPGLLRGAPDMNALVMLGTTMAYGYSTLSTFWPSLLPGGMDNTYFESGAVIITLILLGRYLEMGAKGRTGQAIRGLMALQVKTARLIEAGRERDVPIEEVKPGDMLLIRPGERLPVDGVIEEGASFVDQAMISGEPVPVAKHPGDEVIGGSINRTGSFRFRATRVGEDTLLAQITRIVATAQGAKLPVQALVDKVAMIFVPLVMACAGVTFLLWLMLGPQPALGLAIVNAVAVLIIACPCAMGLATPTSIMVGAGRAAELGVLFRRGEALQLLKDVQIIAFDKTGTLTKGQPELTDILVANGHDEPEVLALAASVEQNSEHPLAEAICRAAAARALRRASAKDFAADVGQGVTATVKGRKLIIGADRLLRQEGVDPAPLAKQADHLAAQGKSPLYVAIDGQLAALFAISDPVKDTTPAALAALRDRKIRLVMITGDNRHAAKAVATSLGIDEVFAEVLPGAKAAIIQRLQQDGARVAFVGDGINDAPALAQADVGIALGAGTDIAIESADVVLMSGDLRNVPNALALSRATMRNIAENLGWAFGYNALLIPVAAGVLYPGFGILLSPVFAGLAMAFSSLSVVGNALRLRRLKPVLALVAA